MLVHCAEIQKRLLNCERKFAFQRHWKSYSPTLLQQQRENICIFCPLCLSAVTEWKTLHSCLSLSYLLNVNHFGLLGDRERNQNMELFYFWCQKILQPRYSLREVNHFADFPLCSSGGYVLVNGFQSRAFEVHINSTLLRRKLHSHSHDVGMSLMAFLSDGAVFCLPSAEV